MVVADQLDIGLVNKQEKKAEAVDVAIPSKCNIKTIEAQKIAKGKKICWKGSGKYR